MGFFSSVGKVFSNPVRALEAVGTMGTSEIARSALGGADPLQYAAPIGLGFLTGNPMMGANIAAGMYSGQMAARSVADANAANVGLAREQMSWSGQQAQQQMAFQERMSSTAVQRAKADMVAAGVNPNLAPTASESTPGGAMGSYTPAHVEPVPSVALSALNSARDGVRLFQDIAESKSRISANAARAGVDIQTAKEKSFWASVNSGLNKLFTSAVSSAKEMSDRGEAQMKKDGYTGTGKNGILRVPDSWIAK